MRFSTLVTLAATAQAQHIGFNYGSTFTDGSAKQQSDFEAEFNKAKSLAGTNGEFTSARLYTMIQGGSTDTPISAIPAAMDTKTNLLLGLWASAGQADFSNEITALTSAINQYGTAFTSLIDGISVGSEDLYRNSPTGIENDSGLGANPDTLVDYIKQVRSAIAGTTASGASVGHVDTWTAWVNGSNDAVITACDWVGMDAYPYFQTTMDNSIGNAKSTFFQAYDNTVAVAQGKEVWVTETGWPVSGPVENQAVASIANAETYWKEVACTLLGQTNTWWYTLQDAEPTTPSPSFGIVGSDLDSAPLYDLSCNGSVTVSSSSSVSSSTVRPSSSAASPTTPASASGSNTESLSQATPGPESSPTVTPVVSSGGTFTTRMTTMITLTTCPSACPSGSAVATQSASEPATTASSTSSSAVSPQGSCPANLNGEYQFPHLIVPVNSSDPTAAYGTQYDGTITPTVSSIFNFDIPASYAGKTCSLLFLFPEQAALQTASYTFNGQGGLNVNELASPATEQTTFDSIPQTSVAGIGSIPDVKMGNSYVVANQACAVGDRIAFEFESIGGLALEFFNDDGPSPLGVFMAAC